MAIIEYNIVLPINFSVSCEKLLESLQSFKSEISYTIHAITVVEDKSKTKEALQNLESFIKSKGLKAICIVKSGNIANEILAYTKSINASIIIINKAWDTVLADNNIGKRTLAILEKTEIPVLVLKNDFHFAEINSILLPLDVNKENKKKITNALFFAKFFHNSLIRIISVVVDANDYNMNRYIYQLQHLVNFIEKTGAECTGEIIRCSSEYGDTLGKTVCDYAEKSEAELVLLFTDHEENEGLEMINPESEYMLGHLTNNIIALTT